MSYLNVAVLPFALLLACSASESELIDLGNPRPAAKGDAIRVERTFEVGPAVDGRPGERRARVQSADALLLLAIQAGETPQPLQLVATREGDDAALVEGRRTVAPRLLLPADGGKQTYLITLRNHGERPASGTLTVRSRPPSTPGVQVVFNQPDCEDCGDRTGGLRQAIVDAIDWTAQTLDLAIYGLDDPAVVAALCRLAREGVALRVLGDDTSLLPDDSRSYYPALYGEGGLTACGADVEVVRSSGIMHHKFYLIDAGTDDALLITGSTNQTADGFEKNHNHMLLLRGPDADLIAAYQREFDQLFARCRDFTTPDAARDWDCDYERSSDELRCTKQQPGIAGEAPWSCAHEGDDASTCTTVREKTPCDECRPSCVQDASDEGPFAVGAVDVAVYFAPSDDALEVLRGPMKRVTVGALPAECSGDDALCVCRTSGSRLACEYCAGSTPAERPADDALDWGLVGRALGEGSHRVLMTMYAGTDQCFALALGRAQQNGARTLAIWDKVNAASQYTRDDYVCGLGVETYVTDWAGGNPMVRNHNKLIVIDDVVFTGSMNISASGLNSNNENTIVLEDSALADRVADYIEGEAALLRRRGVEPLVPKRCLCADLVDNDGDGLTDADDADCDGAGPAAAAGDDEPPPDEPPPEEQPPADDEPLPGG